VMAGCLPMSIELSLKKVPATAAVIRPPRVAAKSARKPSSERSLVRFGARAAIPPTNMANEATCANPHRA